MNSEPKRRIPKKWLLLGLLVVVGLPVGYFTFKRDIYTDPRPEDMPELFGVLNNTAPPEWLYMASCKIGMDHHILGYYERKDEKRRKSAFSALIQVGEPAVPGLIDLINFCNFLPGCIYPFKCSEECQRALKEGVRRILDTTGNFIFGLCDEDSQLRLAMFFALVRSKAPKEIQPHYDELAEKIGSAKCHVPFLAA